MCKVYCTRTCAETHRRSWGGAEGALSPPPLQKYLAWQNFKDVCHLLKTGHDAGLIFNADVLKKK